MLNCLNLFFFIVLLFSKSAIAIAPYCRLIFNDRDVNQILSPSVSTAANAFFRRNIASLLTSNEWISILKTINEKNDSLPGSFQVGYFDGVPFLTYVENRQVFHASKTNGEWSLTSGSHDLEILIHNQGSQPSILKKRVKRPAKMFLVGFETNFLGDIIPIFSDSPILSQFRDIHATSDGPTALREAKIVKLVEIDFFSALKHRNQALGELPPELSSMLKSGRTLTTEFSVDFIEPSLANSSASEYQALILTDNVVEGRTGIILKDGIPLLVKNDGIEQFVELKGIGVPFNISSVESGTRYGINGSRIVHGRGRDGYARTGHVPFEQAQTEIRAYEVAMANLQADSATKQLFSKPVFAISLYEHDSFFNSGGKRILTKKQAEQDLKAGSVSAQVFRLSRSTRRVAYSDNSAFGLRYTRRPELLSQIRIYYGKILGDLLLSENQSMVHDSAHAENFAYFPIFKSLTFTDFADMPSSFSLSTFMGPLFEFGIFKSKDISKPIQSQTHREFYKGLRLSLESRGLWSTKLQTLLQSPHSEDQFIELIEIEYITPLKVLQATTKGIKTALKDQDYPLPNLTGYETDITSLFLMNQNKRGFDPREEKSETISRGLTTQGERIATNILIIQRGLLQSELGQKLFAKQTDDLEQVLLSLKSLHSEVEQWHKELKANHWNISDANFISQASLLLSKEAQILDHLFAAFGLRGSSLKKLNAGLNPQARN